MNLKNVFLYLHNLRAASLPKTNLLYSAFIIESLLTDPHIGSDSNSYSCLVELETSPYSEDHLFVFKNGIYLNSNSYLIENKLLYINVQLNDTIDVFYFKTQSNSNLNIQPTLDADVFIGGQYIYNLKVGALDNNYILVVKNGKIYNNYTILNGQLIIPNTNSIDTITVYYLNRGFIERRAKLSLVQLNINEIDIRYVNKSDVYDKEEFDRKLYSLNNNSPLGLRDLSELSSAISNYPNYSQYLTSQLNILADTNHNHNDVYDTRYEVSTKLNRFIDNSNIYTNSEIVNKLAIKLDENLTYNKSEIDLLITSLPGNNPINRGIFVAGGANPTTSDTNIMDIINISTMSNAIFFGNFATAKRALSGTSNGIGNIALISGGSAYNSVTGTTSIFSMSMLNASTVNYFGDLVHTRKYASSNSNGSNNIGIIISGNSNTRDIEYRFINNAYTGGGLFGSLSLEASMSVSASASSGKSDRIVFGPIVNSSVIYTTEYVTPSTLSNSMLFGNCKLEIVSTSGCSNDVNNRGIFVSGINVSTNNFSADIDYFNISSLSSTISFGSLSIARARSSAISNGMNNRGIIASGNIGLDIHNYSYTNNIEYININSTSNALNFGNLVMARGDNVAGVSNSAS